MHSVIDGRTNDRRHHDANSRSYCIAVRSAKNRTKRSQKQGRTNSAVNLEAKKQSRTLNCVFDRPRFC